MGHHPSPARISGRPLARIPASTLEAIAPSSPRISTGGTGFGSSVLELAQRPIEEQLEMHDFALPGPEAPPYEPRSRPGQSNSAARLQHRQVQAAPSPPRGADRAASEPSCQQPPRTPPDADRRDHLERRSPPHERIGGPCPPQHAERAGSRQVSHSITGFDDCSTRKAYPALTTRCWGKQTQVSIMMARDSPPPGGSARPQASWRIAARRRPRRGDVRVAGAFGGKSDRFE